MARTIADLAGLEQVRAADVAEALGLRRMDRQHAEQRMLYGS
jgi:predicted ATPase with chaperone activity